MVRFLPLIFLIGYLITTQCIFAFGPIHYGLKNPMEFWLLIIGYNICFFIGYFAIARSKQKFILRSSEVIDKIVVKQIPVLIFLAILASLLSFKGNASIYERLNPVFWFNSAIIGALNPGEAYNAKMERVLGGESSNKILNIFLFFIAFSKSMIIPIIVFYWRKLNLTFKALGLFASILPLLASLSFGTNKGVFDFAIYFSISTFLFLILTKIRTGEFQIRKKLISISLLVILIIGAVSFFGAAIGQRGGNLQYIESQDTLSRIYVKESSIQTARNNKAYYTYAWLSSYIVQGYYGFSLALEQPFESTFGFGNSTFIRRNIEGITGLDLRRRTFQYKIDKYWGETSQWHSFYSYLANDFHFAGLGLILIILGGHLAYVWFDFIQTGNPFAGVILCVYVILIIFIPANNQIFGFLDGFSTFFWSNWLWIKSKKLYYG